MQKFLFIIFFLLKFSLFAQPGFFWAKQQGVGTNYCWSGGIAIDDYGNIFTTGSFTDTADFDPDSSIYNLFALGKGFYDIFISKWDSTGNLIWAKSMGGKTQDVSFSLAIDKNGYLYITGYFKDTADFDPGPGVFNLISAGGEDIFICKLDSSGNLVWAKSMGSPKTYDLERGRAITIDNDNNVCLTGIFTGISDFDPGIGIFNLSATEGNNFICKLDSSGNFLWAKQFGKTYQDGYCAVAVDVQGFFYAVFQWDTIGWNDVFVCKLDASGNLIWQKHLPGYGASSITLDVNKNVYLTGGPGIFVRKLDSLGNVNWIKGGGYGKGESIIIDKNKNIQVIGNFYGTVDFDSGTGEYYLSSPDDNNSAIFLLELEPKYGNFICAGKMGGTTSARGKQIAIDKTGNLYAYGNFTLTADLNPGPDVFELNAPPIGNYLNATNAFVTKFSECFISVGEIPIVDLYSPFSLYPNPARNTLTISSPAASPMYFEIKNLTGKTIFNSLAQRKLIEGETSPSINGMGFCTVDISNLLPGFYLIEVVVGEMREVEKFVVVR